MNSFFRKAVLLVAFLAVGSMAKAQLPNEKFGKPSKQEWEFTGFDGAADADAVVLCKTMKAVYQLTDQVDSYNESFSDVGGQNMDDFGKNNIDDSNTLVKYEVRLRTKILKAEGAKHANIDITYYNLNDKKVISTDEINDLKVRVFTLNEKGKVEKRNVDTKSFVRERVDDNYMVLHVMVPDVEPGSIIEYQYNVTSVRPAYIYDWMFQESIPTVFSKCDLNIPAFLRFNMNAPISKFIDSSVEADHMTYDIARPDMKKAKTCITNHYRIVGENIPTADVEEVAVFTSQIATPNVTIPAALPEGSTHLKIK